MLWVTRPSPHIDRTACAWLIRRFIDPEATFAFAPDPEGAAALGGTPFDMRGVELGHHEGRCSFESILRKYRIQDPALDEIYTRLLSAQSVEARQEIVREWEAYLYSHFYVVKLGNIGVFQGARREVQNFTPFRFPRMWDLWFQG